jgi:hypothetical protein
MVVAGALALAGCGGSSAQTPDRSEETATAAEAILSSHCQAQIERPSPSAANLPLGTKLTLRTNPTLVCPDGVSERLSYRFYVEGPSGRVSVQGASGWSSSRLVPFETAGLLAGRYRIYAYSLPTSMVSDWIANDATARGAATRTGYTYVTLDPLAANTAMLNNAAHTYTIDTWTGAGSWVLWGSDSDGGVAVYFAAKPTHAGTYASGSTWDATHVLVEAWDATHDWISDVGNRGVTVELQGDAKLHVLVGDPAIPELHAAAPPAAVTADLTID